MLVERDDSPRTRWESLGSTVESREQAEAKLTKNHTVLALAERHPDGIEKHLLSFGILDHTADPLYEPLEELVSWLHEWEWRTMDAPDSRVVIVEGGDRRWPRSPNARETDLITEGGELLYFTEWARKKAVKRIVSAEFRDPLYPASRTSEVRYLSPTCRAEDIMLYYACRMYPQLFRHGADPDQVQATIEQQLDSIHHTVSGKDSRFEGFSFTFDEFQETFRHRYGHRPSLDDHELMEAETQGFMLPHRFPDHEDSPVSLVAREVNIVRDLNMAHLHLAFWKNGMSPCSLLGKYHVDLLAEFLNDYVVCSDDEQTKGTPAPPMQTFLETPRGNYPFWGSPPQDAPRREE